MCDGERCGRHSPRCDTRRRSSGNCVNQRLKMQQAQDTYLSMTPEDVTVDSYPSMTLEDAGVDTDRRMTLEDVGVDTYHNRH